MSYTKHYSEESGLHSFWRVMFAKSELYSKLICTFEQLTSASLKRSWVTGKRPKKLHWSCSLNFFHKDKGSLSLHTCPCPFSRIFILIFLAVCYFLTWFSDHRIADNQRKLLAGLVSSFWHMNECYKIMPDKRKPAIMISSLLRSMEERT